MVDYSRFDHIDSDEEDGDAMPQEIPSRPADLDALRKLNPALLPPTTQPLTSKGKEGRMRFEYEGRTIYEWEQSLSEVNIFIPLPPGVTKKLLDIAIAPSHLKVGIKGQSLYLDEDTGGPVKPSESMWLISDGEININLQKMNKAQAWDCALQGRSGSALDAHTKEEVKKKLMLERFQEEHPGFDFSGAEFNGQVPDARDFMGGVKHF